MGRHAANPGGSSGLVPLQEGLLCGPQTSESESHREKGLLGRELWLGGQWRGCYYFLLNPSTFAGTWEGPNKD